MRSLISTLIGWCVLLPIASETGLAQEPEKLYAFQPKDGDPWRFVDAQGFLVDGLQVRTRSDAGQRRAPVFSAGMVPSYDAELEGWVFLDRTGTRKQYSKPRRRVSTLYSRSFELLDEDRAMFVEIAKPGTRIGGHSLAHRQRRTVADEAASERAVESTGRVTRDTSTKDYGYLLSNGDFFSWMPLDTAVRAAEGPRLRLESSRRGFLELLDPDASQDSDGFRLIYGLDVGGIREVSEKTITQTQLSDLLVKAPSGSDQVLRYKELTDFSGDYARIHSVDRQGWNVLDVFGELVFGNSYSRVQLPSASTQVPIPLFVESDGEVGAWHFFENEGGTCLSKEVWESSAAGFQEATPFGAELAVVRKSGTWWWLKKDGQGSSTLEDARPVKQPPVKPRAIKQVTALTEVDGLIEVDDEDPGVHGRGLVLLSNRGGQRPGVGVVATHVDPEGAVRVRLIAFHPGKWEELSPFGGPFASAYGQQATPSYALFDRDGSRLPKPRP